MSVSVRLVRGNDDVLRNDLVTRLVNELVGDGDRSLLVDEFDLDVVRLGAAIDAAQTSPFLSDRRIVVVRRFGRYSKADDVADLVTYLGDPLETTALVLVWEKAVKPVDGGEPASPSPRVPPTLSKAVTAAGGEVLDADPPARNMAGWLDQQLTEAGLDVEARAREQVVKLVGEDAGAVIGLIERLRGAFPPGTRLRVEDVEPYLGPPGGVPPWELTDAIDKGDVARALGCLQRMMGGGERHPLAVMAPLQSHYLRMARLDGAGARGEKDAAAILGLKGSTFPAKKALAQAKRLGPSGIRRAIRLLAGADVDLRGARAWPGDLVLEVLVARLARISR